MIGEVLTQVIEDQHVSRETLIRVAEAIPYPSLALVAPAAAILQRLAGDAGDESERARWLVNLSNRLGELGRREEALAAIKEAVTIRRQLAGARPDVFLPNLAMSVSNQAGRLIELGRWEEALAASEEAVTIYRQLAGARPDAFLPDLAMSVNNLARLGRREEALAASEEAVTIYRQLAGPTAVSRSFRGAW